MSNRFVEIDGLVNDFERLSSYAVVICLLFRYMADIVSKSEVENDGYWIQCSYEYIFRKVGIKSRKIIKNSIEELIACGWISDFKKGYYDKKTKEKKANRYCIPVLRLKLPNSDVLIKFSKPNMSRAKVK